MFALPRLSLRFIPVWQRNFLVWKKLAIPSVLGNLADPMLYMLGLGFRGGKRPQRVDWKWKIENHQEGVWLGGVHAGIQYVLRDGSYVRPLNTNFYQDQPLRMPASWFNGGRGGIRIETGADEGMDGPRQVWNQLEAKPMNPDVPLGVWAPGNLLRKDSDRLDLRVGRAEALFNFHLNK